MTSRHMFHDGESFPNSPDYQHLVLLSSRVKKLFVYTIDHNRLSAKAVKNGTSCQILSEINHIHKMRSARDRCVFYSKQSA